jgi:hypothetical protein
VRLAFIISAYKLPHMLVRLVRRLDSPDAAFYIHVDAKSPAAIMDAMSRPLADRPNVHFLPRHPCYWGDFGHVRATLKGLRQLVDSGGSFDYAILLTGQDYPLASPARIAATLQEGQGAVYMQHFPLPSDAWTDRGLDRVEHRQFRIGARLFRFPGQPFGPTRLNRVWLTLARRVGLMRQFPAGLVPYGGSSYWCMPAGCARYVLSFLQANPHVERFFRRTMIPDEMLFQTVVMNSPFRHRVAQEDLRFIDWSGDGNNPRTLTSRDLHRLVSSGKLFARKFDPDVDAEVLDRLDEIIERESAGS